MSNFMKKNLIAFTLFSFLVFVALPTQAKASANTTCGTNTSVTVAGITYTISPTSINETLSNGQGNKNFSAVITPSTAGASYGFSVYGYGIGFPTYGIIANTASGGAVGNTTLSFYFNNNYLSANSNQYKAYSGCLPIHIFTGSETGYDTNYLYLPVNLIVNPSSFRQNTLSYLAGAHGTINGVTTQTVGSGSNGTTVTAVPNSGYFFANWSDGLTTSSRTDTNVANDISVTANFIQNPTPVPTPIPTPTPTTTQPFIYIYGTDNGQAHNSSMLVNLGDTFSILGVPQNLQGLTYGSSSTAGYYARAFFFDQNFSNNNTCGNNEASTNGAWIMTCTAKVAGSSYFYIEIYANGQTYKSNTINVTILPTTTTNTTPIPLPTPTVTPVTTIPIRTGCPIGALYSNETGLPCSPISTMKTPKHLSYPVPTTIPYTLITPATPIPTTSIPSVAPTTSPISITPTSSVTGCQMPVNPLAANWTPTVECMINRIRALEVKSGFAQVPSCNIPTNPAVTGWTSTMTCMMNQIQAIENAYSNQTLVPTTTVLH